MKKQNRKGKTLTLLLTLVAALATAALVSLWNISKAMASVNMWNGNFSHSWTDIETDIQSTHIKIARTYNSRSLYDGVFGFGWCSTVEVTERHQKPIHFNECELDVSTLIPPGFRLLRDNDGRIEQILFQDRSIAEFKYDPTGKLIRVRAGNRMEKNYAYQDDELIEAKDGDGIGPSYRYDTLHNLTNIEYPDQTTEIMSYDDDRDLITSRQGRDGCLELYRFSSQQQTKHVTSEATRKCGGLVVGTSRHDFWHATTPDGHTYLARISIEQLGQTKHSKKEFRFDSEGRLTIAKIGGTNNGLL
jgi:hypothetical protein